MATDIKDLAGKVENEGATPEGTLPAEQFNRLVQAVIENQGSVKKIIYNKKELENKNGVVEINPISSDSRFSLTTSDNLTQIVNITGQLLLHLRATSVVNGSDTYENVVLNIQRFNETTGWTSVGTAAISAVAEDSEVYTTVDVSPFLISGEQQIRIKATGVESNLSSIVSFASIIFTKLEIEFAGEWQRPCRDEMPLSFYVNGAVAKTLHVNISGKTANGTSSVRELVYALGTATYPTTPWSTTVTDSENDACKILSVHGVHKVEAWLTCDDGSGGVLESAHTFNQLMVVADEADTTPFLMLQNIAASVHNYVQTKLLDFAVYNPAGLTDVAILYTDYSGDLEYLRVQKNVQSGSAQSVISTIEIESSDQTTLYAYLRVRRVLPNGSEVDFMAASTGAATVAILVDNKDNYSPTTGADFVLNPKTRDNSEANPARILNAAKNGAEIAGSVFSGFSFINDGWLNDSSNNKVLRVRAGQTVDIPFECFQDFLVSNQNSLTIELDFAVRNITNEIDPIFRICNYVAATGKPLGIEMMPLDGRFMTTSKTTDGEQNFSWQEGVRTHIAFNIVHALRSSAGDNTTLSLVRVFINGVINREFMFDMTEEHEFINGSSLGIRIGQIGQEGRSSAADIDIYSIRVYRKALGSADVLQDYISSLPTSALKQSFRAANDILSPDGTISFAKASAKYNCLVWHGYHTSGHSDADKTTKMGWLEISQLDANRKYDPIHSGKICEATASLPDKGQGSTAKTYYEWNQQYDLNKATGTIVVNGETVPDGFINGNGEYIGQKYQLIDGVPFAQKLVLKINYASSMQSHKQGATELYNDLYRMVVGETSIQQTEGFENTRVAVIERPFLYFTQNDNDPEPVFQGLGTFGPGKMDKNTWGYDKKVFPYFCMMEGSDNNMPLTDMRVPWTDETVKYNPKEEYFEYAGMGNIDFDAGKTETVVINGEEVDVPISNTYLPYMKNAWNWLFMHNCQFKPYNGTASSFMKEVGLDIRLQYWMTQGDGLAQQYDLFCYHVSGYDADGNEIGQWMPAGMLNAGISDTKNLLQLFPDAIPESHQGQWDKINADFQEAMAAAAKAEFGNYFNPRSAMFHYCFVNQFSAGSDNNSKNTYYVLDPLKYIIELHADDLDTIFRTDNVGWQTKPYYIERDYDEGFYEGKYNVLFDLIGRMYKAELPQMMNSIFAAMASLINAADIAKGIEASPAGCMQKYFFSIQEYFPATAFNETARIRYEQAQLAVNKGLFTPSRGVMPITQSLGDQLQSERQFIKRRLIYMQSYAAYGEFSQTGSNALSFQGYPNVDGSSCVMKFDLVPHQWLYPTGSRGQTLINPHVRVAPGERYTLNLGTVTGDTNVRVCGVNYMRSLGNMGDISVNPAYSFPLVGERLTEFIAEPTGDAQFRPSSMTVAAPLLERFSLKGANVGGNLNLTGCTRLQEVNVEGTSITTIRLPEAETLTTAKLPRLLSAFAIDNAPNLNDVTFEGYDYLTSLTIGENVGSLDTLSVLVGCFNASAPLSTLSLRNIDWVDVNGDVLNYLIGVENVSLTGSISTYEVGNLPTITFDMKMAIINKFGNVDDTESEDYRGLKINYTVRQITAVNINGESYTHEAPKVYPYKAVPANAYQNGFQKISWGASAPAYGAVCSMNEKTGELTVTKLSVLTDNITVNCNIVLTDGNLMVVSKSVGLYDRQAALGDYVFADGSYSDVDDPSKTVVGMCCFLGDEGNGDYVLDKQKRLCVSLANLSGTGIDTKGNSVPFTSFQWGLYWNNKSTGESYEVPYSDTKYSLQDDPEYNMYDISSILNITSHGLASGNIISNELFLDENESDGFKKFPSNRALGDGFHYQGTQTDNDMSVQIKARTLTAELATLAGSGYKEGDVVNSGYIKTLKIIAHRNKILQDSKFSWVGAVPQAHGNKSEFQDLLNGMAEVRRYAKEEMGESNYEKWSQFFYPAVSAAYAYQPSVKAGEVLADKFKAHNWFLPTAGQQGRLYWYSKLAPAERNIFAKAIADGKFTDFTASGYWASTECIQGNAWSVDFGSGYTTGGSKYGTVCGRALAAF
ncbi:MAG: hypothetical protein ACI3Z0_03270 [Candidatus Cryptobacteroides sp.]